jgi:hypothetical protein
MQSGELVQFNNFNILLLLCSAIHNRKFEQLIAVAARSKAWTIFAHSNTGVLDSTPTQGMDVCVHIYSVFVLSHV